MMRPLLCFTRPGSNFAVNPIRTRLATLADLDAVAMLFDAYRQFYEQPADLPRATQFIRERMQAQESVILLAFSSEGEEEGPALGLCQLYPLFCSIEAQPIYQLSDLFVPPDARRLGVGGALLRAAEKFSAETGRVRLELTTARTNHTAQAAYASLGWARDEVFLGYNKRVAVPARA